MKAPLNLWPYGIILTFVLFVGGTIGLVVFASTQKVELVNENYYEQELKFQKRIDGAARTRQLGAAASVVYDPVGERVTLSLPPEHVKAKASGEIELYRPSATGLDRQFRLEPDTNGVQVLDVSGLAKGLWKIRVAWKAAGLDYFLDQKIVVRE